MSANYNDTSLFNSKNFEWEIQTHNKTFRVSENQWKLIQKGINEGHKFIQISSDVINTAYIKSVTRVVKIDEKRETKTPEWVNQKPLDPEKQRENWEKIKDKMRQLFKKQNERLSSYKRLQDEEMIKKRLDRYEQTCLKWEELLNDLQDLKMPIRDDSFFESPDIISHKKDRDEHRVQYFIKKITLPIKYAEYENTFFIEAGYIWCPICNSFTKKAVTIYNQNQGISVVRTY